MRLPILVAALLAIGANTARADSRCYALDGDTLQCGPERVRLRGVYAKEKDAPGGEEARRRLQQKIDSGAVRIARRGKDKYGRTLGDVYVGGRKVTQRDIGPQGGRGASSASGAKRSSAAGSHSSVRKRHKTRSYSDWSMYQRGKTYRGKRNTTGAQNRGQ